MPVRFTIENQLLKTWLLLHQTCNIMIKAEDAVFGKVGLTTQQNAVLHAMRYIKAPVTPSEAASWLDRNTNTITTLVDRMEKDGLVRRARDLKDRRSVRLQMTKKGEEVLAQSSKLGWQLVQETLVGLSEEEIQVLIKLLETIREKVFDNLYPGKVMEEVKPQFEVKNLPRTVSKRGKSPSSKRSAG